MRSHATRTTRLIRPLHRKVDDLPLTTPSVIANGQFPGLGWWALGARSLARKVGGAFKERIDEEEAMDMSRRNVLAAGGKAAMIAMAGAPHASRPSRHRPRLRRT